MVQLREESRRTLSPDQLGSYIKVSRPSVWLMLGVIAVLVAGGIAWFFAGTVTESVTGPAVVGETSAVIYVPISQASAIEPGQTVTLDCDGANAQGTVVSVDETPVSLSTVEASCSGAADSSFGEDTWAVAVHVDSDAQPGTYTASVVTATHRPIRLLLGMD